MIKLNKTEAQVILTYAVSNLKRKNLEIKLGILV
jgi:hypothetical protein